MAVEYVQVKSGVLRKGDTVYEVVKFGDQTKYNPGKVVQLLGDKVAQVKLVSNGKTAKIPFKDLAVGAGLFEARTNTESTRALRLEKFKSSNGVDTGVYAMVPVTKPVAPVAPAEPAEPVIAERVTAPQDDFNAWLSIGVDFLPVLEKRIAERDAELENTDVTMAAVTAAHKARIVALEAELLAERELLVLSFDDQRRQLEGWKNVRTLLQPLTSLAGK